MFIKLIPWIIIFWINVNEEQTDGACHLNKLQW